MRTPALALLLALLTFAGAACGGSGSDSGKVVAWSLVEPLTRDDVGLGSLEDTADELFPDLVVINAGGNDFMAVRLEINAR